MKRPLAVLVASTLAALVWGPGGTVLANTRSAAGTVSKVVLVANSDGVGRLTVSELSGGSVRNETRILEDLDITGAAISADGTTLAVSAKSAAGQQLWVADASGANAKLLLSAEQVLHPGVNRDGTRIVASVAGTKKRPHLRVVGRDGTVIADMVSVMPAYHASFSPDGRFVAYAAGLKGIDEKYPLMVADTLGASEPVQIQKGVMTGGVTDVRWSVDGRGIGATVWSSEHYGVGLFEPWGRYTSNVEFFDQSEGRRNGLVYRFAGFVDNATMLTLLDDNAANASRLRTFTASNTGSLQPQIAAADVSSAMAGDLLGADVSFSGKTNTTTGGPLKITDVAQKDGFGDFRLQMPEGAGYQHVTVSWNSPNGTGGVAFVGYSQTGRFGPLVPGATYTVRAVVADLDGTDHEAKTYTYVAPEATVLSAKIRRTALSGGRATWEAKGTLKDKASGFALPYGEVQLVIKPAGKTTWEILDSATTDAKGKFALRASGAGTGYVKVLFSGDDDKFSSEKQTRHAPLSLKVAAAKRTRAGESVKVSAALSTRSSGASVVLERKRGAKWVIQQRDTVGTKSAVFEIRPAKTMVWRVRVLDNAWTVAASSEPFEITVRP